GSAPTRSRKANGLGRTHDLFVPNDPREVADQDRVGCLTLKSVLGWMGRAVVGRSCCHSIRHSPDEPSVWGALGDRRGCMRCAAAIGEILLVYGQGRTERNPTDGLQRGRGYRPPSLAWTSPGWPTRRPGPS